MPPPRAELPRDYVDVLSEIKRRIQQERLRVVLAANAAMVLLYWDIGPMILERQDRAGWGAKVVDRLAADLREAFPDMKGFSPRNLKYMRAFAAAWPERGFVQQVAARIPWFHNCLLLDRVPDAATREWYVKATIEDGWSRNILALQIDGRAHKRHGKAISNFRDTLPPADSDMAQQVFKDPYLFDFLGTADLRREREVEQALVDHIQRFLIELGTGFAFVGRQVDPFAVMPNHVHGSIVIDRTPRRGDACVAPGARVTPGVCGARDAHRAMIHPRVGDVAGVGATRWVAPTRPRGSVAYGLDAIIGSFSSAARRRRGVLDFRLPRGYIGAIYSLSDQPSGLRRGFVFWGRGSCPAPSGGWVHAA